jgi:hypothetical protein
VANSLLTPTIILRDALTEFKNELVLGNLVHRDYSDEFVKKGDTVTIRKPVRYTATDGAAFVRQDTTEGSTTVTIDTQKHVGMGFTNKDLTLTIDEFRKRYIKPAVIELAQKVETSLAGLYKYVWNWVGTPGNTMDSIADFLRGPQRMDEMAMAADRKAVLSPADFYGMLGGVSGLYVESKARTAMERSKLGMLANMETFSCQSAATHTCGTRDNTTPLTNGASQTSAWADVKATMTQSLVCDGFDNAATITAGDVFTIAGVYAINPRTRTAQSYLQQFTVTADATADGSGNATLTISPPIITSGAYQTVSNTNANTDNLALTFAGTASTGYVQNLMFCPDALALVTRPLEFFPGVTDQARESLDGISMRLAPVADTANDISGWRLDILYGVKAINPGMAVRISG